MYSSCCGLSVGVSGVVGRVLVVEVATASTVSMTRSIMWSKRSYITPFFLAALAALIAALAVAALSADVAAV